VRSDLKITRYLSIALIGFVAIAVLALAWPRLQASFRYLPVEIAIKRYYSTGEISSDRLPVLLRFAEQALAHQDHYRFHDGLSQLHLLRATDFSTPALERREAYVTAASEAGESLQGAPAQPSAWLRLASLGSILHEEPETIIAAWKMSIFTGRTVVTLITRRIEIGLVYSRYLDEEAVAMLRDQLLLGWRLRPGPLVQVLASRDRDLAVTRQLIENSDPGALADMGAWLEKLR
jgi:hypothetical protein